MKTYRDLLDETSPVKPVTLPPRGSEHEPEYAEWRAWRERARNLDRTYGLCAAAAKEAVEEHEAQHDHI